MILISPPAPAVAESAARSAAGTGLKRNPPPVPPVAAVTRNCTACAENRIPAAASSACAADRRNAPPFPSNHWPKPPPVPAVPVVAVPPLANVTEMLFAAATHAPALRTRDQCNSACIGTCIGTVAPAEPAPPVIVTVPPARPAPVAVPPAPAVIPTKLPANAPAGDCAPVIVISPTSAIDVVPSPLCQL